MQLKRVSAVAVGDKVQLQLDCTCGYPAMLYLISKEQAAELRDQLDAIIGEPHR